MLHVALLESLKANYLFCEGVICIIKRGMRYRLIMKERKFEIRLGHKLPLMVDVLDVCFKKGKILSQCLQIA